MPYTLEHKKITRAKIIEAARKLFNVHGFETVTIDQVMEAADLTRGGFYNHFKNKQELYGEAVSSFLMGRGAQWRAEAGVDPSSPEPDNAVRMVMSYLSSEHLGDLEGQCPMIALPSDVARASEEVREAYKRLLEAMVWMFEQSLAESDSGARKQALTLAAVCVGGMTLARSLPDCELAEEVREAAYEFAIAAATP